MSERHPESKGSYIPPPNAIRPPARTHSKFINDKLPIYRHELGRWRTSLRMAKELIELGHPKDAERHIDWVIKELKEAAVYRDKEDEE